MMDIAKGEAAFIKATEMSMRGICACAHPPRNWQHGPPAMLLPMNMAHSTARSSTISAPNNKLYSLAAVAAAERINQVIRTMFAFILRRTIQSVVVLFVMSLLVFCMINLVGDPVDMLVNPESLPDEIERVRRDFGLDQPVYIQYWQFLKGALSGDLGKSYVFGRPALALMAERFPATLETGVFAR